MRERDIEWAGARWYCVRAQAKREHIAAAGLRRLAGVEIFCPRIRFQRATPRGKVWFQEALFPGYLFARFDLRPMLREVRYAVGVRGVVHFGDRIPPVPDEIIETLGRQMDGTQTRTIAPALSVGERATVVDGPFRSLEVVVTRLLPASERVRVLLDFLGQAMEVEIEGSLLLPDPALRLAAG
jgi:transcriptional antiterminator RfaH